jgi:hypothetical protein
MAMSMIVTVAGSYQKRGISIFSVEIRIEYVPTGLANISARTHSSRT